jgi:Ser/Thr protein kinase RdoA (MazF antagonist)
VTRTVRSLLHPDDLARIVEREYEVEAPVTARLLRCGFNDSYRITDRNGGTRVLRVYAHDKHWIRSESDLLFELELLDALAAAGRRVSYPYRRRTPGNALLGHVDAPEGARCFALFTFATGAPANDRPLSGDQLTTFGAEIARIHSAMDTFGSNHSRYRLDVLVDLPLAPSGNTLRRTRRPAGRRCAK